MALPSFLCIGAQKAGTSWLYEQLITHPAIWMPPIKELHYFDFHYGADTKYWAHGHLSRGVTAAVRAHMSGNRKPDLDYLHYLTGLATQDTFSEAWYRACFDWRDGDGKRLGDITPAYSTIGPEGIAFLKALIPQVKLIYILRDPLDRAISQLRMNLKRSPIDTNSASAWDTAVAEPALFHRGKYSKYVPEWEAAFPAEQLLFVPYKRIREDPLALLRNIEDFLEVPNNSFARAHIPVHASRKIKIPERIRDHLAERLQGERDFLRRRFGEAFADQT